jgi:hypothetical protein
MWQNSKLSPLMECVSPGVVSQMPVFTSPSREESSAQVRKPGSPAISRSGPGLAGTGMPRRAGSMV